MVLSTLSNTGGGSEYFAVADVTPDTRDRRIDRGETTAVYGLRLRRTALSVGMVGLNERLRIPKGAAATVKLDKVLGR